MMLKKIAAAAALLAAAPAFAAIASGTSGNGELFLVVQDTTAKVSFTLDLGVYQNDFLTLGQQATGYSRDWGLSTDANWGSFLGQINPANLQWAVVANETTGGTAQGGQRTFMTAKVGTEAGLFTWTNLLFSNGTSTSQLGTYFTAINTTGSHGGIPLNYTINGSSVNRETDTGRSYFGEAGGLTSTFNDNTRNGFEITNGVNVASDFYYVTRSGGDQLGFVATDLFDNAAGHGKFTLERNATGQYNLDYTIAAAVPEPGTYGLMFAGLAAVGFMARRRSNAR